MWTHSGYQLSQIARVKPTHSLTSVPLPYSVRSLNPIFLVSKLLSYRFFLLSVVPLSRTPVTGRTLSRRLFLRLNSTILSLSFRLLLPFSYLSRQSPTRTIVVSSSLSADQPHSPARASSWLLIASVPGQLLRDQIDSLFRWIFQTTLTPARRRPSRRRLRGLVPGNEHANEERLRDSKRPDRANSRSLFTSLCPRCGVLWTIVLSLSSVFPLSFFVSLRLASVRFDSVPFACLAVRVNPRLLGISNDSDQLLDSRAIRFSFDSRCACLRSLVQSLFRCIVGRVWSTADLCLVAR